VTDQDKATIGSPTNNMSVEVNMKTQFKRLLIVGGAAFLLFGAFTLVYPCRAKGLAALGISVELQAGGSKPPCDCNPGWSGDDRCTQYGCMESSSGCGLFWSWPCNGTNPAGGGGSGAGLIDAKGEKPTGNAPKGVGGLPGTKVAAPSAPTSPAGGGSSGAR